MFDIIVPPPTLSDVLDSPDAIAAELANATPGPDGAMPVSLLDAAALSHAARVDLLVALERHAAWVAALQQEVLAAMGADPAGAADEVDRSGRDWMREDVSCALRLSGVTAQRRLDVAQVLVERLSATLTLLRRGEISYLHAMVLAEAVAGLDGDAGAEVEQRALRRAGAQSLAEFRRTVRRAVASVAAADADKQRADGMAERRVCASARDDGMSELWALLPAEAAAAVMAAIDALAGVTSADDPRSADQRRADALVDIAVAALHDPLLPKA